MDTIEFYAGATLRLRYEFRDPDDSTLPYPLTGATASVINNGVGQTPDVTITDAAAADVEVTLTGAQTAAMTKRQRVSFQLKVDLNDVGVGDPDNTILILDPTEIMAL